MENIIISISAFLIIISLIVFVHEWGHFYVARLCGVKVDVFAIGFGKKLWSKVDSKGTEWKINMLPFGGYVKMFGDIGPTSSPDTSKIAIMTKDERKLSFFHKNLLQKALIVFAGPLMNYIMAFIVMIIILISYGERSFSNKIASIEEGSPAAKAGILIDDIIESINGVKVQNMIEVKNIINQNGSNILTLTILRNNTQLDISLQPIQVQIPKSDVVYYKIGVVPQEKLIYYSLFDSFVLAFDKIISLNKLMIESLINLISGHGSIDQLGGPIKIAQISGEAAKNGLESFLTLLIILSVNLGLMNLMPIPGLDGGHLMYYAINTICGKAIPDQIQAIGIKFGIFILLSLLVFVTYNDIFSLFK